MSCPHGQPAPSCCLDCLEGVPAERARPAPAPASGPAHVARFDSTCPRCPARIEVGEPIWPTPDGFVCDDCGRGAVLDLEQL